ncbi:MAG: hypothetical protein NVSMB9_05440 [Isosphaeraceae bacterium]
MKALALVDAPDHVCCRYRVRAFEPALSRAGWPLVVQALKRDAVGRAIQLARLPDYETILLQRKLLPVWQIKVLRHKTPNLVFDFDDAVLYRDSYDPRGPLSRRRALRFAATVRVADSIIAGNDFLADCALRAGARPERVRVIPTCVDTQRYEPCSGRDENRQLDLVWIGSSSTLQGLEAQKTLFDHLAREVPGLRFRVICDRFPELGAMPVVPIPWSEKTEATALASGDAGVSWLPDDLWSRGKCGLKVLQYMAAGLPVLANPVGVHQEMIVEGVTGWLPTTTPEWVDAARRLASEPSTRRRMGTAARAMVEANYSISAWESTFVATVLGATRVPGRILHRPLWGRHATTVPHGQGPIGAAG